MLKPIPMLLFSEDSAITPTAEIYDAGATMCLCPLRSFDELAVQIKAIISLCADIRNWHSSQQTLSFGTSLIIAPMKRLVFTKEMPVKLTRKEFDLLLVMASHPNHVFTRDQLYQQVWESDYTYNVDDVVKTHIKTLRKKLSETEQDHIQNVWGVGYRFEPK
ncbi:MAG: response regulator transcription factor [Anaerotignum sp.]|nr:response regulator transcription factor [Anaerotignum sp.]